MCEFLKKVVDFRLSRCLPIEGMFYRRTNLAFSIRYISEKILRLNLRHGRVRQSLGSVDSESEYCPHKYITADERKEVADGDSDENYDSSCMETFERVRMSST